MDQLRELLSSTPAVLTGALVVLGSLAGVVKTVFETKKIRRELRDSDLERQKLELEIERLRFFAEHPDLADPLIWFLPGRKSDRSNSSN